MVSKNWNENAPEDFKLTDDIRTDGNPPRPPTKSDKISLPTSSIVAITQLCFVNSLC